MAEKYYFLEVNTRIQVEHPITEEVVGIDIVALQLYVAAGGKLSKLPELQRIDQHGHAIEVRLCAEDPFNNFLPSTGTLQLFRTASEVLNSRIQGVRYELGVGSGSEVSVYFDSLISKIIVWSHDRSSAIRKMIHLLRHTVCLGVTTNQMFLQRALSLPAFQKIDYTTAFIDLNKDQLLDRQSYKDTMEHLAMVATTIHRRMQKESNSSKGSSFNSIPSSFRNQRKDNTALVINHLSCEFGDFGRSQSINIMVASSNSGQYQAWKIPTDGVPTAAEKAAFFNSSGGGLVNRYYSALNADKMKTIQELRTLTWSCHERHGCFSGEIRISTEGKALSYIFATKAQPGFKKTVHIHCPATGDSVKYDLLDKLSWAGKLDERSKGSLENGKASVY